LKSRNYNITGVDFAKETVEAIRRVRPDLPVRVGDVRDLDLPDSALDAYISLGVVEHFRLGPDQILREAHRVLRAGGLLLVSVPYFSPALRRWAARAVPPIISDSAGEEDHFFQYYFTEEEIRARTRAVGFTPVDVFYYAARYGIVNGIKRSFRSISYLYDRSRPLRLAMNLPLRLPLPRLVQVQAAHMIMIVARKT
jgi:SAM-dependent methyltransferase